ncbi:outer membrane beta-barrel family protein [Hymenobacter elongatus]|uniref:outer membrane beta-barrel family protein n=1 Tax=Hymenobacter elongatus TaxID=877208 RepID=UPI00143697FF|nr:outer membrane beta-barrel family protein [Hymenobacter elongatus]
MLRRSSLLLQEVVVDGKRETITVDIDKMTVDASRFQGSSAASADNLLNLIPGVSVGPQGELKIRGDGNVQILVDGVPTPMNSRQLTDWLRSLPVSAIRQIEVLAPSSARLDAEKTGGALNIVLQKKLLDGYRGSINLGAGTRFNHQASGNLLVKKGRVSSTLSAGLYTHPNGGQLSAERVGTTPQGQPYALRQSGGRTAYDYSLNVGASTNWEVDTTLLISTKLFVDGFTLWSRNDVAYSGRIASDELTSFRIRQLRDLSNTGVSASVSADKQYARGRRLVADALYSYRTETVDNTLYQDEAWQGHDAFRSYKNETAVQLRWEQPMGPGGSWEVGTRQVARLSRSTYPGATVGTGEQVLFDQYTSALYGLQNMTLGKTKLQYGLRAEYVGNRFYSRQEPEYRNSFLNLFPSLALFRPLSESLSVRLSYTRKTRRPGISYLNAFQDRRDPKNIVTGNTSLTPELKDLLDLSATLLRKHYSLSGSLYHRRTRDAILAYIIPRTDDVVVTTYGNAGTEIVTGLAPSLTLQLGKLSLNSTFDFSHYQATNQALGLSNAGFMAGVNATLNYRFNKSWYAVLTGNYDTPRILLNGTATGWNTVGVVVQRSIKDKYLLTLNAQDVFNTSHFVSRYVADTFTYTTDYRPQFQSLVVSATYRFGKKFKYKEGQSNLKLDDVGEKSNR